MGSRGWGRRRVGLLRPVVVALMVAACGSSAAVPSDPSPDQAASTGAAGSPVGPDSSVMSPGASAVASPVASPTASADPSDPTEAGTIAELCERISAVGARLEGLEAVELRATNRTGLDIELSKVEAAFSALVETDLGPLEGSLEAPLRQLRYRLDDLDLAVEDFRTSSRLRDAARHVASEAEAFSDELAAFVIRARC